MRTLSILFFISTNLLGYNAGDQDLRLCKRWVTVYAKCNFNTKHCPGKIETVSRPTGRGTMQACNVPTFACQWGIQTDQNNYYYVKEKKHVNDVQIGNPRCPWANGWAGAHHIEVQSEPVSDMNAINGVFGVVNQDVEELKNQILTSLNNFPNTIKSDAAMQVLQQELEERYQSKIQELEQRIKNLEDAAQ